MGSSISGISLADVRRFPGEQHVPLSRINLLVGPNSIGKTTFLGCIQALGNLANLEELSDRENYFDQQPFNMGSFDTIVRFELKTFSVGLDFNDESWRRITVLYEKGSHGVPRELELELQLSGYTNKLKNTLVMSREGTGREEHWIFNGPEFEFRLNQAELSYTQFTTWLSRAACYGVLPFYGNTELFQKRTPRASPSDVVNYVKFINFFRQRFHGLVESLVIRAIQPCALQPSRRYSHNPLPELTDAESFLELNSIGRDLNIFKQIELRKVGAQYEIHADISGSLHNIQDVGYGITSLLPFLSSLTNAEPNVLFLLQQPEVHIHPSAQAKMVELIAQREQAFMVETHSDHIIDWFRILVKERKLDHTDLTLIFFEEDPDIPAATLLHRITLDERANLVGAPQSYREFFSEETLRLLGLPK